MVSSGHGATSHQPCPAELDTGVSDLDEDCDRHHRRRSSFGWISLLSGLEKTLEQREHRFDPHVGITGISDTCLRSRIIGKLPEPVRGQASVAAITPDCVQNKLPSARKKQGPESQDGAEMTFHSHALASL